MGERKKRVRELKRSMEAVAIVIPKEEAASRYYRRVADSIENEETRNIFLELADQELEHKRRLEAILDEIKKELSELRKNA